MRNLNLNNSYYETLDENFKEALNLIDKQLSHAELIAMLRNGNIPQKQLAALRLETVTSKEDAKTLLNNLTGQDGKIREAVSLKIHELASESKFQTYFLSQDKEMLTEYFLAAIIDINGNICRNILDTLRYFKHDKDFSNLFVSKLIKLIHNLFNKINEFDLKDGKYKINKEIFKLYWCLEAVNLYYDIIALSDLKSIIMVTKNINEYTIREKTAKILSNNFQDKDLISAREELKNDTNYYVRRF